MFEGERPHDATRKYLTELNNNKKTARLHTLGPEWDHISELETRSTNVEIPWATVTIRKPNM